MNAKEYLESKGVFGLDTKKRYNEVIGWMEGYAQEIVKNCNIPHVSNSVCVHPYEKVYQSETECYCEICGHDFTEQTVL